MLVAATLRKNIDSQCRIKTGNILTTPIRQTESLCQKNSDAPKLFNHILDVDIVWFHNSCQHNQWGLPNNILFRMGNLIFAENFHFGGCSAGQLKAMIPAWRDRLAEVGWSIPLGDFCWGVTLDDSMKATVEVNGKVVRRIPRCEGFKALGTTITFDGRCNAEFRFRCSRAWAAYWANIKISQRFEANLYRRMGALERLVVPRLLWCCGSLNLTKEQRMHLDAIQRRMVIKMLNCKRQQGEETTIFMKRLMSKVSTARSDSGIPSFQLLY